MASSVYFFCTALFATYNSATVRCETLTRGWEYRVRFYNIHHIIYASQVDDGDIYHKMMVGSMRYGVVAFPTKWRCSNWVEWLCYIYSMYYLPIIWLFFYNSKCAGQNNIIFLGNSRGIVDLEKDSTRPWVTQGKGLSQRIYAAWRTQIFYLFQDQPIPPEGWRKYDHIHIVMPR